MDGVAAAEASAVGATTSALEQKMGEKKETFCAKRKWRLNEEIIDLES